jgi:hypothetical protein
VGYSSQEHRGRSVDSGGGHRRRRGAWEGEHLEREREREVEQDDRNSLRNGGAATLAAAARSYAAVDLEQFRNYRVGEGYQARHVVRQRTATDTVVQEQQRYHPSGPVCASTANRTAENDRRGRKRRLLDDDDDGVNDKRESKGSPSELDSYLECAALRTFRRELDKILDS